MINKNQSSRMFASDNNSSVHPEIIKAIQKVNVGDCLAYGHDKYTESAIKKFKLIFGKNIDIYFVFNGTGANTLGLSAITNSYNSIITAETAHINTDECGATENFTGCKLITIPTDDGKITVDIIKKVFLTLRDEHTSKPKVISITQSTELGTVYTIKEIKKITEFAHKNNLLVHMDGARLSNAAAALNVGLNEITGDAGVDVLSFGCTKNGLMFGEAVIFFNKKLSDDFKFVRKQGMQLASKMRYISEQYDRILTNDLWLDNARTSNVMTKILFEKVSKFKQIKITQKPEVNAIFAILPKDVIKKIQDECFFYTWNEERGEVRWMTSFETTKKDVEYFVSVLKKYLK